MCIRDKHPIACSGKLNPSELHTYTCSHIHNHMMCRFKIGSRGCKLAEFLCLCVFSLSLFNVARDSMNIGLVNYLLS